MRTVHCWGISWCQREVKFHTRLYEANIKYLLNMAVVGGDVEYCFWHILYTCDVDGHYVIRDARPVHVTCLLAHLEHFRPQPEWHSILIFPFPSLVNCNPFHVPYVSCALKSYLSRCESFLLVQRKSLLRSLHKRLPMAVKWWRWMLSPHSYYSVITSL